MSYRVNPAYRSAVRREKGRGVDAFQINTPDPHAINGRRMRVTFGPLDPMIGLAGLRMRALRDVNWAEIYGVRLQRVVSPVLLP